MTDQPAPKAAKTNPILFYAGSAILIGSFLYRITVTAQEYPMRTAQVLQLVVDAGMVLGLIAIRKSGPQWLFAIALICGIGLFGIRLHSDASWWTGHWHYVFDRYDRR